jgi:hypothetical protein
MTKLIRHLCILAAFALLVSRGSSVANAQAQATASGPGSYVAVGGGVSALQADYGKRVLGGGFAFVDVHPHWRYGLEGEARYLRLHTDENVTETTYIGGAHVYLRPQAFRPYVKFLAGVGRLNFPFGYAYGTYLVLAPGAGIDYMITDRLSVRAIDFEYQDWPQFSYGALHPYGVSVGVSFRVNGLNRFPKR